MARTRITPQSPPGNKVSAYAVAESADFTWAAMSGSAGDDGNMFVSSGNDLVLFRNDNVGAQTVTFDTVAGPNGMQEDITTYSIGIGEYAFFGPLQVAPYRQADGDVYFEATAADVFVAVLQL